MRIGPRSLCALSGVLFVPAWFLPAAHVSGELIGGRYVGWKAFMFALSPILGNDIDAGIPLLIWMVTSAASNVLLVAALTLLCWRPEVAGPRLLWSLAAATALNCYWFFLPDMRPDLRIGYYLWLSAFAVGTLAVGAAARGRFPGAASGSVRSRGHR